ncbi:hypothetical protein [Oceanobacillus halotolerans]|uniref:hypothetical protein n=1 Tax=Oceanobacillus halotolerans TaxID=2663380 RepID=UPI0013DC0065|nr:hypothetical protein [Oceanobacillus halotolerans]
MAFFQWKLIEVFTPFFMPFVWFVVYGLFGVLFIITIIRLFWKKDWKPFVIHVVTIFLLVVIPFNQLAIHVDFLWKKSARNEVVTMIQKETLQANVSHNSSLIHLPACYTHVSSGGGDVMIDKQGEDYAVLFFTFRGVLDNFSGIVYSPNDEGPSRRSFGGDFKEIKKLDEHWYFVSSA